MTVIVRMQDSFARVSRVPWLVVLFFITLGAWSGAGVFAMPPNAATGQATVTALPTTEIAFQDRLRRLEEELRCLVCQNQSLADSHAELAADLRREVENLARLGKTDEEIVVFLKARYGDFVTYRPPLKGITAPLWFGPLLFFVIAAAGLLVYTRSRRTLTAPLSLSPEDADRARSLLGLNERRSS